MLVHEVHPHRRLCLRHPRASLHRALPSASLREIHFVCPGPPSRLGGPEVPPWCGLPVSSRQVTWQGSSRDFRPKLPARHSLSLSIPKWYPLPRYSPPVPLCSPVAGPLPTGLAGHADCLIDIFLQAYPVEDGYQGAESVLEPKYVSENRPVIYVWPYYHGGIIGKNDYQWGLEPPQKIPRRKWTECPIEFNLSKHKLMTYLLSPRVVGLIIR